MATTPHLGLNLLEQAQAQKETTVNTALMRIDALLNTAAKTRGETSPPTSPSEGEVHIVGTGATGAWDAHDLEIAYFEQIWRFITPNEGVMLWVADEDKHYVFDGSGWNELVGGSSGSGGGGSGSSYTDENAQDAVGGILADTATIDFTYNDGANSITADVKAGSIGTTHLGNGSVTYAKMQNASATNILLGRATSGAGVFEEITCTAAGRALLAGADAAAQCATLGISSGGGGGGGSSGSFLLADGSASAPSLAMTNSSTTGFFRNGADKLGFSINGTEFGVFGDTNLYQGIRMGDQTASFGAAEFAILSKNIVMACRTSGASFVAGRMTSNGDVVEIRRDANKVGSMSVTTTATAYNTSSDYRLKEDYQPLANAAARLAQLQPRNFAWKSNGERTDGFIAHEVQAVVPEAVTGEMDGEEMQSIDHSKLVPLLTAALQEAFARIAALEGGAHG